MACTSQGMCVFRTLTRLAAGEAQQQQKQPQHLQPTRFAHHQPALIAAPNSTTERACLVSYTKHEVLLSFCPLFMLFDIACHVLLYVLCRNKTATGRIYALPFTTAALSHLLLGNYKPPPPLSLLYFPYFGIFWVSFVGPGTAVPYLIPRCSSVYHKKRSWASATPLFCMLIMSPPGPPGLPKKPCLPYVPLWALKGGGGREEKRKDLVEPR